MHLWQMTHGIIPELCGLTVQTTDGQLQALIKLTSSPGYLGQILLTARDVSDMYSRETASFRIPTAAESASLAGHITSACHIPF